MCTDTKRTSNRCEVKPEVIEDCETYGTLPDGSCLKRRVVDHSGEGTCIKEEDFVPPKIGPIQDYPPKLYRVIKDLKPGSKKYKQCCGKNRPAPPKSDRYHIEVNFCQEVELKSGKFDSPKHLKFESPDHYRHARFEFENVKKPRKGANYYRFKYKQMCEVKPCRGRGTALITTNVKEGIYGAKYLLSYSALSKDRRYFTLHRECDTFIAEVYDIYSKDK